MRKETIERTFYSFEELSDRAKQNALERLCGVNVDDSFWYEWVPEDCALDDKHFYFDIGRDQSIDIRPATSIEDTAEHIAKTHGETCETYKLASAFLEEAASLQEKIDGGDEDRAGEAEEQLKALEQEFWYDLGRAVLALLQGEWDYRTSEEAIVETIEANEYEFTEDGQLA